jgi:hypothetical protein
MATEEQEMTNLSLNKQTDNSPIEEIHLVHTARRRRGSIVEIVEVDRKEEEKAETDRKIWHSCCFAMDAGAATFLASFIMSFFLMSFAAYQLSRNSENTDTALWSSLLSSIASIWLPNPSMKK